MGLKNCEVEIEGRVPRAAGVTGSLGKPVERKDSRNEKDDIVASGDGKRPKDASYRYRIEIR